MMRRRLGKTVLVGAVLALFLSGCSISYKAVMDSSLQSGKLTKDQAYNTITSILVDKGFDIKTGNKDIGLIATEYKKFGAIGGDPPFDLYLQIKVRVQEVPGAGKIKVIANPMVKEANRLNAAAFTEDPVQFFDQETQKGFLSSSDQVRLKGYLMYYNVLQAIAEALGIGVEDIQQTLEQRSRPLI
jgi:hypothetical protein